MFHIILHLKTWNTFPILLARVIVNDNVIGAEIEKNLSQRLGIVLHVPVEM